MPARTLQSGFRRFWRRRLRRIAGTGQNIGKQTEQNFFERLPRLRAVWRFVFSWTLLFVLIGGCLIGQLTSLRSYYQTLRPVPGGILSVGIEGSFTTASPLYAVNETDTSVSRLLFASLMKYDKHNHLVGDLADRWEVDSTGMIYTVHLRPNLTWQDGQPLTADDVVFTYQTIQEPDAGSPLQASWRGVNVTEMDKSTVSFRLPNPLSSFPYSLTNGIVPKHVLGHVNVADLRSTDFNTSDPIGAGPFQWAAFGADTSSNTEQQIRLVPFAHYWDGAPKLAVFNIRTFSSQDTMLKAYRESAITAIMGLNSLPDDITRDTSTQVYNLPLSAATMVFFRVTSPMLQDSKVRQALVAAADRESILNHLSYAAIPVNEPLLLGQLSYNRVYGQVTNQPDQARSLLDAAGWTMGSNGIRAKNGQPLTFTLLAINNAEYAKVASLLQSQWRAVGIDAKVDLQQPTEFQPSLSSHSYDAVLHGISIGVDPDVFVYWDSSQADVRSENRLNFSEYKSNAADLALEAGRTRLDPPLRTIKYKNFLQAWQQDAPALGLYQPRLLYVSHTPIYGLDEQQINTDADHLDNVQNWMVHTGWVTNEIPSDLSFLPKTDKIMSFF